MKFIDKNTTLVYIALLLISLNAFSARSFNQRLAQEDFQKYVQGIYEQQLANEKQIFEHKLKQLTYQHRSQMKFIHDLNQLLKNTSLNEYNDYREIEKKVKNLTRDFEKSVKRRQSFFEKDVLRPKLKEIDKSIDEIWKKLRKISRAWRVKS